MLVLRTDLGKWGLLIGVLIHVQIYALLFVLQWCSLQVKTLTDKIEVLKTACEGSYQSVELLAGGRNTATPSTIAKREELP